MPAERATLEGLSIIVPTYFNASNIPITVPTLLGLREPLREMGLGLELVFVDDGSRDETRELLDAFHARYPNEITVARLTRSFGSMAAIQAGLSLATGRCVGMIGADLRDPPELFIEMVRRWRNGAKAVLAVRADREEGRSQRFLSNVHDALIRRFALPDYPAGGFDFFLIDRQVVGDLVEINEKNTNLLALIVWLGYEPQLLPYTRRLRETVPSRATQGGRTRLFIESFVAFSNAPIRILSLCGMLCAAGSFLYGAWVFLTWAVQGNPVRGFTPVVVLLSFTAGLQMTMLGVLGEYLWRTLDETRRRPVYVIDRVTHRGD